MLKKLKFLKKPLFQKRRWSCDFPPRKTRVAQKYRAISCQEKMAFSTPVGLSWHSLPSPRVCADGRTYSLRSRRKRGRGRGAGENGVLRGRDEGTPATKTPIFSSPPTNFYVIQLSYLSMQPPIRNRRSLFCMTDFTQEFNEASKNKVRMRILFQIKEHFV